MRRFLFGLLITSAVGVGSFALAPSTAKADDYWNSYWSWNDNAYRPYYSQNYAYQPSAYAYPGPYTYSYSYYPGYSGGYYPYGRPTYYGGYPPGPGVYGPVIYGGRGGVGVGFGWW